jgi:peptide/nickel transport system substrate-binding protein
MSILVLVASACTGGGEHDAARQAIEAHPRGGTLRAALPNTATVQLDPQRAYDALSWELFRCCLLRTLYSYNGTPTDGGGAEPRPDLASGAPEISADGLTWTFRLRDGLRYAPPFEDTAIGALDLVRALERTARANGGYADYYSVISGFDDYASDAADSIVGLETPDDRTLVVRLEQVTGDLAYRFSMPATAPIPAGAVDGHGEDYSRYLVASGPYMIQGSEQLDFSAPPEEQEPVAGFSPAVISEGVVQESGSLVLVRNPSWDPAEDRLRLAYPDRIELSLSALRGEELARRVDDGEVDLAFGEPSPFEQVARYREDPALKDRVFLDQNDYSFDVTMNLAVPPFDDVHVRRAVSRSIDKDALVDMLSQPPYGPFGQFAGAVATHVAPDALEGGLLRAFDPYSYDPVAAREEMRGSAYDRTGDGVCDAPVCRHVRALVMDAGVIPDQARAIRDDLAEVGIELELHIVPPDIFFGDTHFAGSIHNPGAQIPMGIAYPWGQDYPDGGGWFPPLFGRSGITRIDPTTHEELQGANTSLLGATPAELKGWGYAVTSVPAVDDRLEACLERHGVARVQCWAELDQFLTTEIVSRVPYFVTEHAQVVSERVVGYSFDQWTGLPALDRIALAPGSD